MKIFWHSKTSYFEFSTLKIGGLVPTPPPPPKPALVGGGGGGGGKHNIAMGIQFLPTRSKFTFFQVFFNFWSNAPKCRYLGGGMCMLFEIYEKRPFQKCMGWEG